MQVADLLAALAADISDTRLWVTELRAELAEAELKLADLQVEAKAVENALGRYGEATTAAVVAPDPEWAGLTRTAAIERVLRDHGPLHLTEIQTLLVQRGCERSQLQAISATLTNLGRTRSSVVNVGKGRWDYVGVTDRPEKLAEPGETDVADPPPGTATTAGTTGTTPPAVDDPTEGVPGPVKLSVVP